MSQSALDINQHVNNVKFVEWVVEGIPAARLKASVPSELEINFLAEAFHEDQILATCSPQDPDNTIFHHSLTANRTAGNWRGQKRSGEELIERTGYGLRGAGKTRKMGRWEDGKVRS